MLELEPGKLRLFGENAINTSATPEEAAKNADYYNTSEYLEKTFFKPNKTILTLDELGSGGRVTIMKPSGAYSEPGVMVIAAGPHSFDHINTPTETIYQYPDDVQEDYWESIMDGLAAFNQHVAQEGTQDNHYIFATENCMVTRTSLNARVSRSIALPHAQIVMLDKNHIEPVTDPSTQKLEHLVLEQKALRFQSRLMDIAHKVSDYAYAGFSQSLRDMRIHTDSLMGYSFVATRTGDAKEVRDVMNAHHHAYTIAAKEWVQGLKDVNQKKIKPQPSYRLYMAYENGVFKVANSPEFLSHAGVMEALGVRLDRSPSNPKRIEDEKIAGIHAKVKDAKEQRMNRKLEDLNMLQSAAD